MSCRLFISFIHTNTMRQEAARLYSAPPPLPPSPHRQLACLFISYTNSNIRPFGGLMVMVAVMNPAFTGPLPRYL